VASLAWATPCGEGFPHEDGEGFDVMLQALPIHGNGKIVLRENEAKDSETDDAPAEDRSPPRGRKGDGERNTPRRSQRQ
jgi:hypothetical protein